MKILKFLIFAFVFKFASLSQAAEIRNGYLHSEGIRAPVAIATIEKTEFHFDRIDESLATNARDLEYIRLRNDEELWVNARRYAIVNGQRIPISLDQEFQIMTARIRRGSETAAPQTQEGQEVVAATNSLQIESIERSTVDIIKTVRERLATFDQKTFPKSSKVAEVNKDAVPKSLSLWRAIIDNQNVYLEYSPEGIIFLPFERTVRVTARDPNICNLPTVKPASNPNLQFFELRNGSMTYWAQTLNVSFDPMLKYFITATPGGQTLCINETIMKSSFEDGEFGPR